MKKLAIANWKMNGNPEFITNFFADFGENKTDDVATIFCVPSPLIERVKAYETQCSIAVGAEDCHYESKGAYTGDISPLLIKELGAQYVVLGHSERREYHFESNEIVNKKVKAALNNGLKPIICIGETEQQREQGIYKDVIKEQLHGSVPNDIASDFIIAYEPVWAIGTGKVPTNQDIEEVFTLIRKELEVFSNINCESIRILYGGSANAGNCNELASIPNLSGYLVGSASMKPTDFQQIIASLATSS